MVAALGVACVPHDPPKETARVDVPSAGMPGPAAMRGAAAARENAACERCHEDVARSWRGSLHQRATIEPAYQRALAIEPLPFCRGCHSPEGTPDRDPDPEIAHLGVGCVTCHVVEGAILAGPARATRGPTAPHPTVRDPRFATAAACSSCHEFAFPGAPGLHADELMQSTVREHARSSASDASCASCHMPLDEAGRRSHAFRASRAPEILRAALRADAVRTSATSVSVTLRAVGVGHAYPTGDLFRRLEVRAEAYGPDNMVLASARRYLTRHFELRPGALAKRLVRDDRLRDAPVVIDLDLGADAADKPVAWRVGYQRVAHPDGISQDGALLEDDVELARGDLP